MKSAGHEFKHKAVWAAPGKCPVGIPIAAELKALRACMIQDAIWFSCYDKIEGRLTEKKTAGLGALLCSPLSRSSLRSLGSTAGGVRPVRTSCGDSRSAH